MQLVLRGSHTARPAAAITKSSGCGAHGCDRRRGNALTVAASAAGQVCGAAAAAIPPAPRLPPAAQAELCLQLSLQGEEGLVARFPDAFRALPLVAGAAGIVGVVANRVASGVSAAAPAGRAANSTPVLRIGSSRTWVTGNFVL
jgi:hypothetical protein